MSNDYYANNDARLNTVIGGLAEAWVKVKGARKEYMEESSKFVASHNLGDRDLIPVFPEFLEWLEDKYGIHISTDPQNGGYKSELVITDEKKYIVFQLRFG